MSPLESVHQAADLARYQARAFGVSMLALALVYVASHSVPPGVVTAVLVVPPCLMILMTCLARVNDIGPERMGWIWQVRRMGLVLTGAGAAMFLASPWTYTEIVVPWRSVILTYGVALAWLTTPVLPPWWDYITGAYRSEKGLKSHVGRFSGAGRRTGELEIEALKRALRKRRGEGEDP
jgi:hypothetical protein